MMKFQALFANKFFRFLAFIVCWVVSANIIILFNPPKPRTPNEFFSVCVIENTKPTFKALNQLQPNTQLCQQPIKHIQGFNEAFHGYLEEVDNNWELTEYGDSMADPFVYRYRIENNQVIPLWYTYGGMQLAMSSYFFAFFISLVLLALFNRIFPKNKKPNHIA